MQLDLSYSIGEMTMLIKKTYTKQLIKYLYCYLSPVYYHTRYMLKRTERWSEDKLHAFQLNQLKLTLRKAYESVPYYQSIFKERNLHPDDIKNVKDIERLPTLSKEEFKSNIDSFISTNKSKKRLIRVFTGGTTGEPMPLYRDINDFAREVAVADYAYTVLGANPFAKSVHIRGEVNDSNGCFYKKGLFNRRLFLSSSNLSDENLKLYVKLIRDFKPRLAYTLPSVATILAEYMERNKEGPFESLLWACLPSEALYDFQEKLIERVLDCKVKTYYGHAEHTVFATQCMENKQYHILPQYGLTELIDKDGNVIRKPGVEGEIVSTAFTNRSCPLIRYRTGDYGSYTSQKCSCGRNYKLLSSFEGRGQSVAIAKDNSHIPIGPLLLCTLHDKAYGKIKYFQIEQRRVGELIIWVLPHMKNNFNDIANMFTNIFAKRFPQKFYIKVKMHAGNYEHNRSLKHRFFVQHHKI
jgi:phenylacetate-CoA ligase